MSASPSPVSASVSSQIAVSELPKEVRDAVDAYMKAKMKGWLTRMAGALGGVSLLVVAGWIYSAWGLPSKVAEQERPFVEKAIAKTVDDAVKERFTTVSQTFNERLKDLDEKLAGAKGDLNARMELMRASAENARKTSAELDGATADLKARQHAFSVEMDAAVANYAAAVKRYDELLTSQAEFRKFMESGGPKALETLNGFLSAIKAEGGDRNSFAGYLAAVGAIREEIDAERKRNLDLHKWIVQDLYRLYWKPDDLMRHGADVQAKDLTSFYKAMSVDRPYVQKRYEDLGLIPK